MINSREAPRGARERRKRGMRELAEAFTRDVLIAFLANSHSAYCSALIFTAVNARAAAPAQR